MPKMANYLLMDRRKYLLSNAVTEEKAEYQIYSLLKFTFGWNDIRREKVFLAHPV